MEAGPLVTTIIPTYNRASLVCAAIESVLQQSYRNVEVIVVDDGSIDDTQARLAPYGNAVRVIVQDNAGPAAARNRGIEAARGEIVTFLDSDDAWNHTILERQVRLLQRLGDSVACSLCNATMACPNGEELRTFECAGLTPSLDEGVWDNPAEVLATRFVMFTQMVAIRRRALERIGGFDETLWVLEDYELALRLSLEGPWGYIREPLVTYRQGSADSLTAAAEADQVRLWECVVRLRTSLFERIQNSDEHRHLRKPFLHGLRASRRILRATQLSGDAGWASSNLGRTLARLDSCRSAIHRRSPWYPKMKVTSIADWCRRNPGTRRKEACGINVYESASTDGAPKRMIAGNETVATGATARTDGVGESRARELITHRPRPSAAAGPLMTIVIPTYNRAHLLAGAIESVLAQTYADFRLIVSDNVSTDETASVAAEFDDPRLSCVRRPRHLDLNEHYNEFTAEVDTKYLFILPDDDRLLPSALETLVSVLEKHPGVGMVHGRARIVDGAGATIHASHDMTGLTTDTVEKGDQFIAEAIRTTHRIHGSTVLFRTEAIKSIVLDPRDFPATEFGFWLRMALHWDIAFIATTVAVYRVHPSSYTSAHATAGSGGYVQSVDTIENIYKVKLRFLEENGARLHRVNVLRRAARLARSAQLVNYAGRVTLPERSLGPTIRTLLQCARRDPRVLLEPGTRRLVAASILGPRLVDLIKGWRRAITSASVAP
jgi:glycosyltransferase involved in cell wall biosynthesis